MREVSVIAKEIRADWKNVYFGAEPYLNAMHGIYSVDEMYGFDSAKSIIQYFLSNSSTWRGPKAREIKAELKKMVK